MAGEFDLAVRPTLAGAFFKWEGEETDAIETSVGATTAIIGTSSWGPLNTPTLVSTPIEFDDTAGALDTELRRAVRWAFKGEGRPGKGGAGAVLFYRAGTGSAAKATRTLVNTAGTPASALVLTGKYEGTYGNTFTVTTAAGPDVGTDKLTIKAGTKVLESYVYDEVSIASLAAKINGNADSVVTATVLADGVSLATVTDSAFAGGNDGATLTGTEWAAAMAALERKRFGVVAPANLTDSTIRSSLIAWVQGINARGLRTELVVGGAAAESYATGAARSAAINDPDVVNLGVGTLKDTALNLTLSTAQMAPRVAGAIANRGERRDLLFARFTDLEVVAGVTLSELATAPDVGLTVFSEDTQDVPAMIREGVTTYATQTDPDLAVDRYRVIRNVMIQHAFERELTEWAESGDILGELGVNARSRATLIGHAKELLQARVDDERVQPGFDVVVDPTVAQTDDDDFVQLAYAFHPTRPLRQMFNRVRIG